MTEAWRDTFRRGFAPLLSTAGLEALAVALETDDPRLLQGVTTEPPPLQVVADWPVERACLIGYCAWQGDGKETVQDVEEEFGRLCFAADMALEEPAGCRHLLNAYDDTPRSEFFPLLLEEVRLELERRKEVAHVG